MNGLIGRTISHYHLLEQVGQGGMSGVFLATDMRDQRQVAIKILSPYLAHEAQFHARFEREIQLLRRLQHPNIIPILDFGEADGLAYIVMPYLAAGTLHQRLQRGPLDPVEGGRIIEELASALTCAHNNGVIHRDVKPSNVLLDDQGHALLSDFSVARPQDASQNLTGSALIGTPAYMAPEQCRGDPIDVRSDQYSFAVMLYQMTTGQLPFEGETPMAIAIKHVSTPLPRPREVNPNLPQGIELVLIRALAKDPALRFGSIEELNGAFQTALGTALDPSRRAAGAKTQSFENTLALYRRCQNVKPPPGRRAFDRSAVVAALLLLLACTISSAAIAVIYPDLFATARAAPSMGAADIQATVDVVLTANAPAAGTVLPPGAMETAVYEAVLQTLQASVPPEGDILEPSPVTDLWTATASPPALIVFPTSPATATRTPPFGVTPSTPTRTPAESTTQAPPPTLPSPASATQAPTQTSSVTPSSPAPTSAATATPSLLPPTTAAPSPTSTPLSPTSTSPPSPTSTLPPLTCEWDTSGEEVDGDTVSVDIINSGDLTLHVTGVGITWTGNEHLVRVKWSGFLIWYGNNSGPSVYVPTNRTVAPSSSRKVEFRFDHDFDGSASVTVDGDC